MTRAIGPRPSILGTNAAAGWFVLIGCWSAVGVFALIWVAAALAAAVRGGRVAEFGSTFATDLLHGHTERTWPGTPTSLVATFVAVLGIASVTLIALAAKIIANRLPVPGDPVAALERNPQLRALTEAGAAETAMRLRPSLAERGRRLDPDDIGLALGDLQHRNGSGPTVYAGWRDTMLSFMAPGGGKTTSLAIPHVLSAPGPVIATSNKNDLWAATTQLRAERTGGKEWLFDLQRICHQEQTFWFDLLPLLTSVEEAHRATAHFVISVADEKVRDLWGPAAHRLLRSLFLAAAVSGKTLTDVVRWINEPAVPTPAELLDKAGYRGIAHSLRGTQHGALETRDGIYETARTAATCLEDPDLMAWITPTEKPLPRFDPAAFVRSRDVLYLLSENLSNSSPLLAAITDITMRTAIRQAERMGGRLDPPLTVAIDEAANICRIADLPGLYSHVASRGVVPNTILQSYEQGVSVWGEHGMAALWGASTKKLIGAGVDSPRLTRDVSQLVGHHDVPVRSVSYSEGRPSEQISVRRQEILEASDIRSLPNGSALLLATGIKPALLQLRPWFESPRAATIGANLRTAEEKIRRGANRDDHARAPNDPASREVA